MKNEGKKREKKQPEIRTHSEECFYAMASSKNTFYQKIIKKE